MSLLLLLLACNAPRDAEPASAAEPELPVLVDIDAPRELRAAWIATVANIDWPSRSGLSAEAQQAELVDLLVLLQRLSFNAVMFQVRSEGDAMYRSDLEPWSRFLSGTQGEDPGYDPLQFLIEQAHARNIEVHAWFNPYRAKTTRKAPGVSPHVSVERPEVTREYGALLWMDPGEAAVRERTAAVVLDVVSRYDVDGVHFDDYFYPYPTELAFPDAATYAAYTAGGGALELGDWRRQNVSTLVRMVSEQVRAAKPWVRFGVSPFGIYRPGQPEGIRGLDQVDAIYADPLHWTREGWVDYLAPQLYWPTTQEAQAYEVLLDWWADAVGTEVDLFAGNYLSQIGNTPAWSAEEYTTQHALARQHTEVGGNIWFSGKPLIDDRYEVRSLFEALYDGPALPPPVPRRRSAPPAPPTVELDADELCLSHEHSASLRAFAVYAWLDDRWSLEQLVAPAPEVHLDLPPGRYAVTAVGRDDVESQGAVTELRAPGAAL